MKNLASPRELLDIYHRGGARCQQEPLSTPVTREAGGRTVVQLWLLLSPAGALMEVLSGALALGRMDTFKWIR